MPVPAPLVRDAKAKPQESWWRADMGAAIMPIAEVRFEVEQAEFRRAVRVSASEDDVNWQPNGTGEIYRFRQGNTLQEWLRVPFPFEVRGRRYWCVQVVNGNDPRSRARDQRFTPLPGT